MKNQKVIIQELTVENWGTIGCTHRPFTAGIQSLDMENAEEILHLVLGDRSVCMKPDSRVTAVIDDGKNQHKITCYQGTSGRRSGFEQMQLRNGEEHETVCFKWSSSWTQRLQMYLKSPELFNTNICTTGIFRHYLRRFIRTFKPEKLVPGKDLWLRLERDGRFSVRHGKSKEEVPDLSETESFIFRYLCFLQVRRFWDEVRSWSRFPAPKLPVVVRDFSGQLDESVDYNALLHRALKISGQVFVIS